MRTWQRVALAAGWMSLAGASRGQMHKVAKPEAVVRAVGVYEWTGDLAHPDASRLVPVTLYIDQKFEDAALYLARPVPFALDTGNIYELDEAGVAKGTVELDYARRLHAAGTADAYDDGWFGYGRFKAPYVPKAVASHKLQPSQLSVVETGSSQTGDKPHFSNKAGQPVAPAGATDPAKAPEAAKPAGEATAKSDDAAARTADPDRPHFSDRKASPQDAAAKTDPADDPDRPTMKRRGDSASSAGESSDADDPDRPTLKRRSPEAKAKAASAKDEGLALNDDPDRPSLHRGNAAVGLREADFKKLAGLPVDLHQMVAVSDAADRPPHLFARPWDGDAELAAVLTRMRSEAAARLAAYPAGPSADSPSGSPVSSNPVAPRRTPNSKLRLPTHPVRALSTSLEDEQLKGFQLSYGDVPTFVYQAHTPGTGAALRYVTLVAQRDAQGEPRVVLASVTDETHLDRAARLRLIDAVDVDASNRASLIFEMRGQTSRQFAVYRVLGLRSQQIFATGSTQ